MRLMGRIVRIGRVVLLGLLILPMACVRGRETQGDSDVDSVAVVGLDSVQAEHDMGLDARAWADSIMYTMTSL